MFPIFDLVEMTGTLGSRVGQIHAYLKSRPEGEGLCRLSLAVHDRKSGRIRTLAFANDSGLEVSNIEVALDEVPSLKLLSESRSYRKIDDILTAYDARKEYSAELLRGGIRSSLTFPIRRSGLLLGYVFLNSPQPAYFTEERTRALSPVVAVLSLMMIDELVRLGRLAPVS